MLSARTVVINELMADNKATVADQDGEYDDWLELYNPGTEAASLAGLFLSDKFEQPTLYALPDTVIPAGGYLIVWADDDTLQVGLHAGFKLSADGEAVYLFDAAASLVDYVVFPALAEDIGYGRYPDGSDSLQKMYPSFDGPNRGEIPEEEEPDSRLFGDTLLHTIDLHFYVDNWAETLKYNFEVLDKVYMPARLIFDDTLVLDSIGVRYKGNSSYLASSTTPKKPFEFKFDKYVDNQRLCGVTRLNVHNGVNDPTYMRETISYGIARRYMPAPRTAYGNVSIDGDLLGLYVLVEQIDKTFLSRHFSDNDGNLYKADNDGGPLIYRGTDQSDYAAEYELKTNEDENDWSRLVAFIDLLNNADDDDFLDEMEDRFNLDLGLRLLAFNMVLSNFDSYTGSGRNFYLYDDPSTDRFTVIPWDFNESFGVFTNNWNVLTQDVVQISNLNLRPLNKRILAQPSLRRQYRAYIADMIAGPASYDSVATMVDRLKPLLDASVQADTNKLYSYAYFVTNTDENVSLGPGIVLPGLKAFSLARNANLAVQAAKIDVYPGDTDNDGEVDASDILPLGVYFLTEGPARGSVSSTWAMQVATPWDVPAATYADANGDGIVDEKDVVCIGVNWDNGHDKSAPSYAIDPTTTTLSDQTRDNLTTIYNGLTGDSEPVTAMKTLLESILDGDGATETATPSVYALEQNYPNPFNPTTTIAFSLPTRQTVTLTIYDITGRVVFQPIAGQAFEAGRHEYPLDFSAHPSGIYFCRISTEQGALVRKLSLIK